MSQKAASSKLNGYEPCLLHRHTIFHWLVCVYVYCARCFCVRIAYVLGTELCRKEEGAAYRHIWDFPADGSIESAPLGCRRLLHRAGLLEWHCFSLCSLPFALTSQPTHLTMLQVQAGEVQVAQSCFL